MAKGDKFYFENFAASCALSKEAAIYLVNCLENYNPDNIEQMMQKMHDIEHRADVKKHEMNEALAKAFVTPVDKEDLDMLSHKLDDVTETDDEENDCRTNTGHIQRQGHPCIERTQNCQHKITS